mmetsp:Transcript_28576/g.62576  ORF Transcript_28576/g.62576 Transcript_28576/m.62576 type:complete len:198 (-) Transcript_28576:419-1012(-)|eukprot:CAMPEP_0118934848 /NCGR_PEP_ID=MMETSP1169-20130426/14285_1 /TAXON_ID=36882 /ORGANISM="Pyramimonas obovata, Strain CCMP722" /LENGTH=197 /DNA_ID=CAMNT_0006877791 /DNA_START=74 /DNA_END=667 /DNA_ORIENTATION=+
MATFTARAVTPQAQTCSMRSSFSGRSSAPLRAAAFVQTKRRAPKLSVQALKDGYAVTAKPANDQGQIEIDVSIDGSVTKKEFDKTLKELGTNSPVIPGYRRTKGGKNAAVPKGVLLQMMGKKRVYGFLINTLISNAMMDYTSEEGLDAEQEAKVEQDNEKLLEGFEPGKPISFQATLQLKGFETAEDSEEAPVEEAA